MTTRPLSRTDDIRSSLAGALRMLPCRVLDPRPSFVYAIQAMGSQMVKVGRTVKPSTRILDLQIGSPLPLVFLAICHGHCRLEESLHLVLRRRRSHGEWFRAADLHVEIRRAFHPPGDECLGCLYHEGDSRLGGTGYALLNAFDAEIREHEQAVRADRYPRVNGRFASKPPPTPAPPPSEP